VPRRRKRLHVRADLCQRLEVFEVLAEDLFDAKIVDATSKARELVVHVGMTGREAVETLLAASSEDR